MTADSPPAINFENYLRIVKFTEYIPGGNERMYQKTNAGFKRKNKNHENRMTTKTILI